MTFERVLLVTPKGRSGLGFALDLIPIGLEYIAASIEEGVKLAIESLKSSTQRDTGSGYGMDIYTITKQGIKKVVDKQ